MPRYKGNSSKDMAGTCYTVLAYCSFAWSFLMEAAEVPALRSLSQFSAVGSEFKGKAHTLVGPCVIATHKGFSEFIFNYGGGSKLKSDWWLKDYSLNTSKLGEYRGWTK